LDDRHWLPSLSHSLGYADLVRRQCAGAAGLLAAGAGCLPGDGGLFVDQLALVLGQRVKISATIRPTGAE
jgi:hypothetical protein